MNHHGQFARGYELLNENRSLSKEETTSREQACESAFCTYENMRGRVIGKAITVESAITTVLQVYFCPTTYLVGDEVHMEFYGPFTLRQERFTKIVLSARSCTFQAKTNMLRRLLIEVGIVCTGSSPRATARLLERVRKDRNLVAHARVGVDFESNQVSVWDDGWTQIPLDFETAFNKRCELALTRLQKIGKSIKRLEIEGNPKDEVKI